jgi:hypothetical protein
LRRGRFYALAKSNRPTATPIDAVVIHFEKPGVYHMRLGAADRENWTLVSLWRLRLGPATAAKRLSVTS